MKALPPFDPLAVTRRHFFKRTAAGLGGLALSSLLGGRASATSVMDLLPSIAPKAKRVIYLFQAGGPS